MANVLLTLLLPVGAAAISLLLIWQYLSRVRRCAKLPVLLLICLGLALMTRAVFQPHPGLQDVLVLCASVLLGALLGFFLAILFGMSQLSLPTGVLDCVTRASGLLNRGKNNLASDDELLMLGEVAQALLTGASESRCSMTMFSQGIGYSAWRELQSVQVNFETAVARFIQRTTNKMQAAESPRFEEHWQRMAEYASQLARSVADGMTGLSARVVYYQQATSLLVTTAALVVAVLALVYQAWLPQTTK